MPSPSEFAGNFVSAVGRMDPRHLVRNILSLVSLCCEANHRQKRKERAAFSLGRRRRRRRRQRSRHTGNAAQGRKWSHQRQLFTYLRFDVALSTMRMFIPHDI